MIPSAPSEEKPKWTRMGPMITLEDPSVGIIAKCVENANRKSADENAEDIVQQLNAYATNQATIAELQSKLEEVTQCLLGNGSDAWTANKVNDQAEELASNQATINSLREMMGNLLEFASHDEDCAMLGWEAGEPTIDGGYRTKIRGKWYQSRPVDETPKCNCGCDEIFSKAEQLLTAYSNLRDLLSRRYEFMREITPQPYDITYVTSSLDRLEKKYKLDSKEYVRSYMIDKVPSHIDSRDVLRWYELYKAKKRLQQQEQVKIRYSSFVKQRGKR